MPDAPRLSLAAACSAICIGAMGCNKDACTTYQDDIAAKLVQCKVSVDTSTTAVPSDCTPPASVLAQCLDACLTKIDCNCWRNPNLSGCKDLNQPYLDCLDACKSNSTTTSGASSSSSSSGG